ncbi:hypothetical protein [Pedobacter panaciterrae]|uniref:hypothetical protein n=1 Tax=Pedobacter panaciterrae TaxID=363849 RepID=UPI0025990632|nr:hypothetical protein [uncultured Pedobacter sp.]
MYFKTVHFPSNLNHAQVETALRKASMKETISLDFTSKSINIGIDKIFWGLERKRNLKFTRIRTSFEFFLPKLIINLSKNPSVNFYKIRPGALSIVVAGLLFFGLFTGILGVIKGRPNIESLILFSVLIVIYIALMLFELRVTASRAVKVLNQI